MPYTNAIELLSPARDRQCGIEALRHGADAVYMGGPGFGARVAAGNSVDDIRAVADYAHQFGARVYVTMNTIVYDDELEAVRRQAWDMYHAGVDALIVQDVALLAMDDMPPIALHASTQMDNRTPERVAWLWQHGYRQAVLARELTLEQIAEIHRAVPQMPLEVFVHGAVCVSLSGRCYASQVLMGRSANRGECAQVCRLPFGLVDGEGRVLERGRHLLSLCDMNRSQHLEAMMDAGVSSFKIEGRLKDVAYVKNITAYYRRLIDEVLARRPDDFVRSSRGASSYTFTPDPEKSFNRGFTDYFLTGEPARWSPYTPKMMGPEVATIAPHQLPRGGGITVMPVAGASPIVAGDGLCYLDANGQLQGFRVNRVEDNRLFFPPSGGLKGGFPTGAVLHRNHDQAFESVLAGDTAERRIDIDIIYNKVEGGFALRSGEVELHFDYPHEPSHSPQDDNIRKQLSRLGDTPYRARVVVESGGDCFVPSSVLAQWRRALVEQLAVPAPLSPPEGGKNSYSSSTDNPNQNISNHIAAQYLSAPINAIELSKSVIPPSGGTRGALPLMTCRHCIRRAMGMCGRPIQQPWHLVMSDGRKLRLHFDCKNCQMLVYADR